MRTPLYAFLVFLLITVSCKEKHYTDPLEPQQALNSFQLDDRFTIELFASEPFVNDPVAMTFDDQGNIFVVEMHDYPFAPEPGKERGQIRMLIDSGKDGRIDKSIIFADSLSEATSILPWNGGLIVAAAPGIYFFKDTNSDFRADTKELLFEGFFKGNSEAQITGLYYNVDNWIYATNSGHDGKISSPAFKGTDSVELNGSDFRFRLDRNQFEQEVGSGQFGQAMDEWGHRFVTENSFHIEQAVIPWRYLHRRPGMPSTTALVSITDHQELMNQATPPPYWRAERTKRRNKEFQDRHLDRTEYADDHFTGAAGAIVYGGDAFPGTFSGNYFVGDVAGNLVHRDILSPSDSGPALNAKRGEGELEFLTSTDPWFRPVNFCVGPDGSLYVIDMYRQHIESPFSIPEDLKEEMDFMKGSEMGRIYRIVPKNATGKNEAINFRKMNSADVTAFLSHPNYQLRIEAQKTIVARQDKSVVPAVKDLMTNSNNAHARLHALYVLEGLNALNAGLVQQAMNDANANVRECAVRLAGDYPECLPLLEQRISDSSMQVALAACLSVGNFPFEQSAKPLMNCLTKYGDDEWFKLAVVSSKAGSSPEFVKMLPDSSILNIKPKN
ncbi:MAG: dehydrogenase [Chitinophagaceae bacterium]|nr:dehydrogenase [Chitinophagaceae bacterium]